MSADSGGAARLSIRQEHFARGLAEGKTQSDALRDAYPRSRLWKPASVHQKASKLAAKAKVIARVAELKQLNDVAHLYAQADAMREADAALVLARSNQDVGAMLAAIGLKARLAGLFGKKPVTRTNPLDLLTHEEVKGLLAILELAERNEGSGCSTR